MNGPSPFTAGSEHSATASEIVRQFGVWQSRALRSPVCIIHRGRPRLVLTSIDLVEALYAARDAADPRDAHTLSILLDSGDDVILILDGADRVTLASRAARAQFGHGVADGAHPRDLARIGGDLLADAIRRVAVSGIGETVEIVPDAYPSRRLHCDISPFPGGSLMRVRDGVMADELAALRAQSVAAAEAGAVAGALALRLSVRGYLIAPTGDLGAITGIAADSLAAARLTALLTVGTRVATADAMEAVAGDGQPRRAHAELMVRSGDPLPVSIGLAAVRIGGRIEELRATLIIRDA